MTGILIALGVFAVCFIGGFIGCVLPALRHERRLDDAQLRRWAREDGLPDGNAEQLRAYYAAGYPDARRP